MVALIVLSYVVGLGIEKFPKYSKWILTFGILSNLSALIYYKYWMFLLENINLCYSPPPNIRYSKNRFTDRHFLLRLSDSLLPD